MGHVGLMVDVTVGEDRGPAAPGRSGTSRSRSAVELPRPHRWEHRMAIRRPAGSRPSGPRRGEPPPGTCSAGMSPRRSAGPRHRAPRSAASDLASIPPRSSRSGAVGRAPPRAPEPTLIRPAGATTPGTPGTSRARPGSRRAPRTRRAATRTPNSTPNLFGPAARAAGTTDAATERSGRATDVGGIGRVAGRSVADDLNSEASSSASGRASFACPLRAPREWKGPPGWSGRAWLRFLCRGPGPEEAVPASSIVDQRAGSCRRRGVWVRDSCRCNYLVSS